MPGPPEKRFDYLTIDPEDHYLISAHLAAGQTYVIDLRTNKLVATVTDTPGAEGVEYVPQLRKFYTSNADDNIIGDCGYAPNENSQKATDRTQA
jgi:DNA-binding beta-propeller fold protein YncE